MKADALPHVDCEVVLVTPKMALQWLSKNTMNRCVVEARVDMYSGFLSGGEWLFDAMPIRFDVNGTLLDGQHRLLAIARTSIPAPMLVVRGIPTESFKVIDTGRPKNHGDMLSAIGEKSHNILAGAARAVILCEGKLPFNHGLSTKAILDCVNKNPDLRKYAVTPPRVAKMLPPAIGVAMKYLFSRHDPSLAEWFFDRMLDGQNLSKGDPVLLLRDRLGARPGGRGTTLSRQYKVALTIKAWNATRQGRTLQVLKWVEGEEFPDVE